MSEAQWPESIAIGGDGSGRSWEAISGAPRDGSVVTTGHINALHATVGAIFYPLKSRFIDGEWCAEFDGKWKRFQPQPTHYVKSTHQAESERRMSEEMTAQHFIAIVASKYSGEPDDYVVSIGHWAQIGTAVSPMLPTFYADIRVTVGELRKMALAPSIPLVHIEQE